MGFHSKPERVAATTLRGRERAARRGIGGYAQCRPSPCLAIAMVLLGREGRLESLQLVTNTKARGAWEVESRQETAQTITLL